MAVPHVDPGIEEVFASAEAVTERKKKGHYLDSFLYL